MSWVRDITSFGGIPVYGLVFLWALATLKFVVALQLFISFVVFVSIAFFIRFFYAKTRPDGTSLKNATLFEQLNDSSFPSIHAGRTVILAVVLSKLFSCPACVFLWALVVCVLVSRILLRKHFLVDVIAGAVLGWVVALAVASFI